MVTELLSRLYVDLRTPEDFGKFILGVWAGDIGSDVLASAIATAAKLGGRAYEGVKVAVKFPLTLVWLWLSDKVHLPPIARSSIAVGMIGGVGRDLFKLILGLAPESYGSLIGMTLRSWVETALGASKGGEGSEYVMFEGIGEIKSEAAPPAPQPATATVKAEELFLRG